MTLADLDELKDAKDIVGIGTALSDPNIVIRHCATETLLQMDENARIVLICSRMATAISA